MGICLRLRNRRQAVIFTRAVHTRCRYAALNIRAVAKSIPGKACGATWQIRTKPERLHSTRVQYEAGTGLDRGMGLHVVPVLNIFHGNVEFFSDAK